MSRINTHIETFIVKGSTVYVLLMKFLLSLHGRREDRLHFFREIMFLSA